MKLPRRALLQFAVAAVVAPGFSQVARAQTYPSRPITMIVPVAAGGPADRLARIVAEGMRSSLGQAVIIENVTGADGSIGVGRAVRARPDGYTIDFGVLSTHVLNGAFYSLPYDPLNDFVPIVPLVRASLMLVGRKSLPVNDLSELIGYLKSNPKEATAGVQIVSVRLLAKYFQQQTGARFTLVPYRGSAPALQDLLAGQIDLMFDTPSNGLPQVRAGSIKAYAVTGDRRLTVASDIPTFAEMGLPALSYAEWAGLFAPKGTSRDVIAKLNAAVVAALTDPAIKARIEEFGAETFPREQQTPEVLAALVKTDAEKWWPIIKEFGIKAE